MEVLANLLVRASVSVLVSMEAFRDGRRLHSSGSSTAAELVDISDGRRSGGGREGTTGSSRLIRLLGLERVRVEELAFDGAEPELELEGAKLGAPRFEDRSVRPEVPEVLGV